MRKHPVSSFRLYVALAIVLGIFGAIGWRLFDISIRHHEEYAQTAAVQAGGAQSSLIRGDIFISDASTGREYVVATNRRYTSVTVAPNAVPEDQRSRVTAVLSQALGIDAAKVAEALISGSRRRIVARRVPDAVIEQLRRANLPDGIEFPTEIDRAYPAGELAADVIGFYGHTETGRSGQYGVEEQLEGMLSGQDDESHQWGFLGNLAALIGVSDAGQTPTPHDVVLTLDRNIQGYAEQMLAGLIERFHAVSGTIIVQDPQTGRLMALADTPTFTPDSYGSFPGEAYRNSALTPFEPGSSFKPVTMAIGLSEEVISPDTTFVDDRDIVVDGYTIKNFNEQHFGRVTMTQVLEKSINAGTMYVQSLLSQDVFLRGVEDMGFGLISGIDLPGDAPGNLDNLRTGRRINYMTASFGQGITTTPIQLITAYSAIANGGRLMRPYIVASVRDDRGAEKRTDPEVLGTPFTEKVAHQLRDMLVSVVDKGFDKARIARYDVAGKTGTAQIASPEGGYLEKEYNHSFVGFAPASNPQFTILIKLERPQGVTFAADSLTPAFHDMAVFLLNYLNVSPTR
ncbi:MAG TPA: penicillin-binding protein 2 [Candidatus Paceibacterota bacterium]|nr:penicillin-binding protein 2 [Candidatus Paceibacterota bacterium]